MGVCAFALVVLSGSAFGGTTNEGEITNITGELKGDWYTEPDPSYIPASEGHFGLDTLSVPEFVPGEVDVPGAVPRPAEHWADLCVTVCRVPGSQEDAMIAIDKDVYNGTPYRWTDFHMSIGILDIDQVFPQQGLDFKDNPAPVDESDLLGHLMRGENQNGAPELWWFSDDNVPRNGAPHPGVSPGETARFWLGITVPSNLFFLDSATGQEKFTFTIRQHWTPSPGAMAVLGLGGLAAVRRRR